MGIAKAKIIGGPAKHFYDSATFWSTDDFTVNFTADTTEIRQSMHGKVDEAIVDPKVQMSFTPFGLTGNTAKLIPAVYTNGIPGTALVSSEKTWQVWAADGDLITIENAFITKPPSLILSADKPIFGPMEVTGHVKETTNDADPSQSDSVWKIQSAQADPGGQFVLTNYKQERYSAALGAAAGFTDVWPEDGFTIDFQPVLEAKKIQGITVNYRLKEMAILVRCKPTGPTMTQVLTQLGLANAAGYKQGARLSTQNTTLDLVIKDAAGATVFTLNKPAIKTAGFVFGVTPLRVGEIGFLAQRTFTAGAVQNLSTLALS